MLCGSEIEAMKCLVEMYNKIAPDAYEHGKDDEVILNVLSAVCMCDKHTVHMDVAQMNLDEVLEFYTQYLIS
jgi:hypothetical protein